MSDWIDVAPVKEFPPGTTRVVDAEGVAIAVFNVNGRYCAIEDQCTHEAETLSNGKVEGFEVTCPRHAARFSLISGDALSPPAYEPVAVFPVQVEDGVVQVRDDRFD
jgi:3-phenylpropionate/trans-cinnamate dioxygenase ferredoxin subunit